MADGKKDPTVAALEAVHAALKPLAAEQRRRVLASVYALLGMPAAEPTTQPSAIEPKAGSPAASAQQAQTVSARPLSLMELVKDKQPSTSAERIALFAYYREKYEGKPRFARDDLSPYFAKIHEKPPSNYPRDFTEAVKRGWLHEEGEDSYITSSGIEAVEAGFPSGPRAAKATKSGKKTSGKKRSTRTSAKSRKRRAPKKSS